ncbi:MAG TPA: (deoxy)nucleoside triphosphate pyrophosphohydrolase [Haloplasmataceae bacterium]
MKTIHVVAAVIRKNRKILCCQRSDRGPYGKKWEFPGGKVEPGEKPEDALVREIREELDVEIMVNDFLMRVEHSYPSFNVVLDVYLATITNGILTLKEHLNAKWLGKEDLKSVDWLEADLPILDRIIENGLI